MKRRSALALASAAFLSGRPDAHAQPARKVPRIGYLTMRPMEFENQWLKAFQQGLRELGYVEGENIFLVQRHAQGSIEKAQEFAADMVRLNVDVLVATETTTALVAKKATDRIPIVSFTQDPVATGLAASLARPGGNVTGMSDYHADIVTKRLQLLKEIAPAATRIAVLLNSDLVTSRNQIKSLQEAAPRLGLSLVTFEIDTERDVDRAFAAFAKEGVTAVFLVPHAKITGQMRHIASLALKQRLPAAYTVSFWAKELGGLIAYGIDFHDYFRRGAAYVDKILKGAQPGELPIQLPTKFELVVNKKTAKALGLTIPQTVLLQATEVIE